MSNLLYFIAIVLIICWLLGVFVFNIGAIIHLLLIIAVISLLLRIIRGEKIFK